MGERSQLRVADDGRAGGEWAQGCGFVAWGAQACAGCRPCSSAAGVAPRPRLPLTCTPPPAVTALQVSQMVSRELERECVVVFDEAHNIDNVCIEALSGGAGSGRSEQRVQGCLAPLRKRSSILGRALQGWGGQGPWRVERLLLRRALPHPRPSSAAPPGCRRRRSEHPAADAGHRAAQHWGAEAGAGAGEAHGRGAAEAGVPAPGAGVSVCVCVCVVVGGRLCPGRNEASRQQRRQGGLGGGGVARHTSTSPGSLARLPLTWCPPHPPPHPHPTPRTWLLQGLQSQGVLQQQQGGEGGETERWLANPALPEDIVREAVPGNIRRAGARGSGRALLEPARSCGASAGGGLSAFLTAPPPCPSLTSRFAPLLFSPSKTNERAAEHFVAFLQRFVGYLRTRLATDRVVSDTPASFLASLQQVCGWGCGGEGEKRCQKRSLAASFSEAPLHTHTIPPGGGH